MSPTAPVALSPAALLAGGTTNGGTTNGGTTNGGTDGRRLRRERNRLAVVDALLELYRRGNLRPSSTEIAEEAGLSPRSLFRYFDDVDDLCAAAVARAHEEAVPLLAVQVTDDTPLPQKVEALVGQRIGLFQAMAPAATVMRVESWFQPTLARELEGARAVLRDQLRAVFAPELRLLADAEAEEVLAAIDVLCSFESYQLMRSDQRLNISQVRSAWARSLILLLGERGGARAGRRR